MKPTSLSTGFRVVDSVFLFGLGALISLAACGGGGTGESPGQGAAPADSAAAPPSSGIDPCALVTKAEAEEALGAPVGEAERPSEANIPPHLSSCRYTARRGAALAILTLMVRTGYGGSESKTGFESAKQQFPGAEAVAGIGEDAFFLGNQLNILQGNVYLTIGGDFDLETAKTLGQRALQRID